MERRRERGWDPLTAVRQRPQWANHGRLDRHREAMRGPGSSCLQGPAGTPPGPPGHRRDTAGTPPGPRRDPAGTPPGPRRDTAGTPPGPGQPARLPRSSLLVTAPLAGTPADPKPSMSANCRRIPLGCPTSAKVSLPGRPLNNGVRSASGSSAPGWQGGARGRYQRFVTARVTTPLAGMRGHASRAGVVQRPRIASSGMALPHRGLTLTTCPPSAALGSCADRL